MINTDRIVPVTAIDLISLYALIIKLNNGGDLDVVEASTTDGQFELTIENNNDSIANEPVKSVSIDAESDLNLYFVAAYDYEGFTLNGAAVTTTGVTVNPDGRTLYRATISSGGTITIEKIGF